MALAVNVVVGVVLHHRQAVAFEAVQAAVRPVAVFDLADVSLLADVLVGFAVGEVPIAHALVDTLHLVPFMALHSARVLVQ